MNFELRNSNQFQPFIRKIEISRIEESEESEPQAFKSVTRTAAVLRCLSKGINSVTDIAMECKLNKSTTYRLLKTMENSRLVIQDPFEHRYFLGPLITEIASNPYVPHEQLVLCSLKEMKALSDLTGESIGLHILIGFQTMFLVHEIQSTFDMQIVARYRTHTGLHTGGTSKALLSQLHGRYLKIVLDNLDFKPFTKYSVPNLEELKQQLKKVQKTGYAEDISERMEGVICLSVPIKNYILPASLSILGPENRIKPRRDEYLAKLIECGVNIQKKLDQMLRVD